MKVWLWNLGLEKEMNWICLALWKGMENYREECGIVFKFLKILRVQKLHFR